MEDRRCTLWSLGLTAAVIGLALVYSTVIFGATHRGGGWFSPPDGPMMLKAGSRLLHAQPQNVYGVTYTKYLYTLPLSFPLTGLVAFIVSWLRLPSAPNPEWIFVVIPMFTLMGAPVLQQTRKLAWDLGMRQRLWAVQTLAAFLVLVPEVEWGHVEDVLALACVLVALRRLLRQQPVAACFYVSLAIGFKQWAVIILPFFVLAAPAGKRLRGFLAGTALPAGLALLFLTVAFRPAFAAYFSPATQVVGYPGHPSFAATWLGAHSSLANRTIATVLAASLAWRRRHLIVDPYTIISTVALILMIRPLTETINYSYYWSPGLLLLALLALADRRARTPVLGWLCAVLAMAWTLPHSNPATDYIWWGGELLLLGVVAWDLAHCLGFVRRRTEALETALARPQFAEVAG